MASGSSDKEVPLPPLIPREAVEDRDGDKFERHNGDHSEDHERLPFPHDPRNPYHSELGNGKGSKMKLEGIAGYVPAQRLEWKRYKQYTRQDIMAAIEEVKTGKNACQLNNNFQKLPLALTLMNARQRCS